MIRMSSMKKTFENVEDAKVALEETKYQTADKYNGTTYEFSHKVKINLSGRKRDIIIAK